MPITVSPEAEAKVELIPNFTARLERFIHEQFELEQWRTRRVHDDVAKIVEDGLRESARLKTLGIDRSTLFARLQLLTERLTHE